MSVAGVSRPMRAAGVGLLGIAAIAAVIGTAVTIGTDDPTTDTAAPSDPAQPAPEQGEAAPDHPDAEDPGGEDPGAGDPDEPAAPGTPDAEAGDPEAEQEADRGPAAAPDDPRVAEPDAAMRDMALRVFNNSDLDGLAERAAADLTDAGWRVTGAANFAEGRVPASTVYFRPGTDEELVAHAVAREFGMRVEPRFAGIADASPGIIVIITGDYEESIKEF